MRRLHIAVLLAFLLVVVTAVAVLAAGSPPDPKVGTVTIEVDGNGSFDVLRVDGLGARNTVVENVVNTPGGPAVQNLPGPSKVDPITIRYYAGKDGGLVYDWRMAVEDGSNYRVNATIVLADGSGNQFQRWCLTDAWPATWKVTNVRKDKRLIEIATLRADALEEC